MRITGGEWGGRRLGVPRSDLRPTQDRVREAVFSSLGEYVAGARVLDLFAGSGAYGLEALSRGAEQVCWVESDRGAVATIRKNILNLAGGEGGSARVIGSDVWKFLKAKKPGGEGYTLIFADPPYDRSGEAGQLGRLMEALEGGEVLALDGVLVYEQDAKEQVEKERPGWSLLRDRTYGKSRVLMYRSEISSRKKNAR